MDSLRDRRVFDLVARATALPTAEREALLAETDPDLAGEVRRLLDADRTDDGFLRPAPSGPGRQRFDLDPAMPDERLEPGARFGPFTVREPLGAGGMGQVYLAEQVEPIRRTVALKVLRLALAGAEARRRFVAEWQAMARLEHPNVGRILDAGTTEDGTPYLAMEHIPGPPLSSYCEQKQLGLEDRIRLFTQVCRAVDHAHHKLLLHRDIKPSNILVAEVDGQPVPKLIDFGIAKRLDDAPEDGLTRHQILGTPQFMSPEALAGGELDTRSDVFSLGVVLYQLLTGHLPWRGDGASLATVLERRIKEEPRRPSAVAASLPGERLRGDLDAVVLKAISLDPDTRYGSAAELAADLDRFLAHEPVLARAAGTLELLGKALVRHRRAALAITAVGLALVAGTVGTSLGLLRAKREAAAAAQARDESKAVADFLAAVFDASAVQRPEANRPPSAVTALELLDRGAEKIERELAGEPRVRARLELVMGRAYRHLGSYEPARRRLTAALAVLDEESTEEIELSARALLELANVEIALADRSAASSHLERVLDLRLDSHDEARKVRANALINLGRLRRQEGAFDVSIQLLRQAIEIHGGVEPPDLTGLASALSNLGSTYFTARRFAEAEAEFRRAQEVARPHLPAGHATLAQIADNLAAAVASQGRLAEAAPLFEEALSERRRMLGDRHPAIAQSLNNLGVLERDIGRPERAVELHREALAMREELLGPNHPDTAWSLDNLARALAALGRFGDALPLERRALAIRLAHHGPDHPDVADSRRLLGEFEAKSAGAH